MIKVIEGHRYNSDKSKEIAETSNFSSYCLPDDFNYWKSTLMVTQAGYYFEYDYGNAASQFSVYVEEAHCSSGGEKIEPVEDPNEWIKEHKNDEGFWVDKKMLAELDD